MLLLFFFFKQKTAYEMRISDWSSDVCSSDLAVAALLVLLLDRGPGDLVRHFLARLVAAPLVLVGVFVPGAVVRLLVDLLRVLGQVVAHGIGQVADGGDRKSVV